MAKKKDITEHKDNRKDSICTVNGEIMTVEERNRRMKLDYINGGKSLRDIAEEYGLTYNTVRVMSCEGKWKDYKEAFTRKIAEEAEKQLTEVYVATKVDVNLLYNNAWQTLMYKAVRMLNTGEGLTDKNGQLSVYKLNQLADVIAKCHNGQMITTGFITKEAQARIDIQRESMDLRNLLAGLGEDEVIEDNFLQALNEAAKRCGIGEDSNGNSEINEE